jgi:hypothetical protein
MFLYLDQVFDDVSGLLKVTFPSIEVDASWKTNITAIEGALLGFYHRIKGNTGLAAAKISEGTSLVLVSDFDLSTGGTIVLFAKEDGTFKEVSRTSTQMLQQLRM